MYPCRMQPADDPDVRVGVMILPEFRWPAARARWRAVEDMGFASGWTLDHLWWRTLRDEPWFSTFPFLTAAATATGRLRIGTLVTSPNFRHPVLVAKDSMTIDDVSGGRFTLGVGAGSVGAGDANVIDDQPLSARRRGARFAEFVELVDELLRTPVVNHRGEFYLADEARTHPGCVQQPRLPLALAATGPRGRGLAARFGDAWVSCGPLDLSVPSTVDEFFAAVQDQTNTMTRTCEEAGRDPGTLERIVVSTDTTGELTKSAPAFLDHAARYAAIGIDELVIQWPRDSGVFAGDPAVLEDIAHDALPHLARL